MGGRSKNEIISGSTQKTGKRCGRAVSYTHLTNDIDAMANRIYQKKEISLKEIWTEGCELKKKYWGMPERWNHKMLTRKTLPYFLIVKMLDKSIKLWDPEAGMEEVQHI